VRKRTSEREEQKSNLIAANRSMDWRNKRSRGSGIYWYGGGQEKGYKKKRRGGKLSEISVGLRGKSQ